jgi:hypothetical protein
VEFSFCYHTAERPNVRNNLGLPLNQQALQPESDGL